MSRSVDSGRILLAIVCFGVGIAIAAQWRSQVILSKAPVIAGSVDQSLMIGNLVQSNARLRDEIEKLESQSLRIRQEAPQDTLATLVEEISRLRVTNGLAEALGPGLEIRLEGRIGVFDVQDVINELRSAGTEAISLNGQRIVGTSVISEAGSRIMVDGISVATPYVFAAIGDPQQLEMAFARHGGTLDLLESRRQEMTVSMERRQEISLPVYRGSYNFRFASVSQ